ncbi:MAG: type II toxin-antitoxin system PemK/MazF family toxin [Bdellovibrionota bacterium]
MTSLVRGEIWLADLDPIRGHEQAGRRPILVLSATRFNEGPAGLVVALPITGTIRPIPSRIEIQPPEGGLTKPSSVICEGIRSLSHDRLVRRLGKVRPDTLSRVGNVLRYLLEL